MKNTSGLYVVTGICLGLMGGRLSAAEPAWFMMIVPAGIALIIAILDEHKTFD